jgi:hypothetical protein
MGASRFFPRPAHLNQIAPFHGFRLPNGSTLGTGEQVFAHLSAAERLLWVTKRTAQSEHKRSACRAGAPVNPTGCGEGGKQRRIAAVFGARGARGDLMVDYLRKRAARISDRAVLLPPSRLGKSVVASWLMSALGQQANNSI